MNKNILTGIVVSLSMLLLSPGVMAGCKINIAMKNSSNSVAYVTKFVVKSKGGVWREALPYSNVATYKIKAKDKLQKVVNATFGCKAERRYRFKIQKQGVDCIKNIYHPSPNGWTRAVDIDFGDISRHCE